jgi:hypothetical protein
LQTRESSMLLLCVFSYFPLGVNKQLKASLISGSFSQYHFLASCTPSLKKILLWKITIRPLSLMNLRGKIYVFNKIMKVYHFKVLHSHVIKEYFGCNTSDTNQWIIFIWTAALNQKKPW